MLFSGPNGWIRDYLVRIDSISKVPMKCMGNPLPYIGVERKRPGYDKTHKSR
jgi:hypothetical protein